MEVINIDDIYFKSNKQSDNAMYHYTSANAIINIFKEKTIRFTNCLFLNDVQEYNYIFFLIKELIETKFFNEYYEKLITEVFGVLDKKNSCWLSEIKQSGKIHFWHSEYYVLCGTTQQDSLPMWNYYVKSNGCYGYNIKISVNDIVSRLNDVKGKIFCGQIIYDRDEQMDILKCFFNNIIGEWEKEKRQINDYIDIEECNQRYQGNIIEYIQNIRLFFKDSGFKHEKEYRIVILPDSSGNESGANQQINKGYSINNGVITPYIGVTFNELPIEEICISPTVEKGIAKIGLENMLNSYNPGNKVKIAESKIKIRY